MKINLANELVNNHTTEEIIAWTEKSLRSILIIGQDDNASEGYRLGLVLANLGEVVPVLEALDKKLNRKDNGPVVA